MIDGPFPLLETLPAKLVNHLYSDLRKFDKYVIIYRQSHPSQAALCTIQGLYVRPRLKCAIIVIFILFVCLFQEW